MRWLNRTFLISGGLAGVLVVTLAAGLCQAVLFLVGVGFGAALAGARFGFTTGWRQLVEQRDPRGMYGQLLLLALAAVLAMPLLGRFSELHAALGPPSISLLVGAFLFGLTMQIADGCGSGTLYKAGLGVPLNMGILPLFALGSFLGSVHLDKWLALGQTEPVSLSAQFGTVGALAITLALEMDEADVTALDRSREALWVAMANAARLGASVSFVQSDWFSALGEERFDLIVANPPYIAAADPHLEPLAHEPASALVAGRDGLDDLRAIIAQAPAHLAAGGWLLLEHGHDQAAAVRELLETAGFEQVSSRNDLAGIARCSGGRWPGLR